MAFDGSDQSQKALTKWASVAIKYSSELIVLHVYWGESADVNLVIGHKDPRDEDLLMKSLSPSITSKFGNKIKLTIISERSSDVAFSIVEQATKRKCDLIVIGAASEGKLKQRLLGSVTSKVLNESNCNVLVVK